MSAGNGHTRHNLAEHLWARPNLLNYQSLLLFCRLFSFNPNTDFSRSLSGPHRKKKVGFGGLRNPKGPRDPYPGQNPKRFSCKVALSL